MLSLDQFRALRLDLESDQIERTVSTNNTDKFAQAVCAFANDLPGHRSPGYLFVGVNDDGSLNGLKVSDQMLKDLAGLRADGNILPIPSISVYKLATPEGDVAVVEVIPSDLPPVRYKGRVWIRVGPRRATASEQEERILSERRVASARTFDLSPCPDATVDDLSVRLFEDYRIQAVDPEVIAANNRSLEAQLASLRFFVPATHQPTYAGLLLFGKNPRFFLPGAYVQFLRFSGNELTDLPEDQSEISGDLFSVIRELEMRAKVLISVSLRQTGVFQEHPDSNFPEWAIRELLMNALMHRDYSSNAPVRFYCFKDWIEIQNPGGLYGEATPENFPEQNSYRNPVIAEAMKTLGFVNRYGYGVKRAQRLLKENGNPEAVFEFKDRYFIAKVFRRQE